MNRGFRATIAAIITTTGLLAAGAPATQASAPPVAAPQPAAVVVVPVRVASYNVCKSTCGSGTFTWTYRRLALLRTVRAKKPDVLAVQEANTYLWRGVKHIDDVRSLLGPIGYRITSTDYNRCTVGCTRGAHLFYNRATMRISSLPNPSVAVGMAGLSTVADVSFGTIQDRNVSWAFLTPIGSSKPSLYMSVHLPTDKTTQAEALRVAVAAALRPFGERLIAQSGRPDAQLVIAGDLNSYAARQPYGAQKVLRDAGLIDGFTAPVKVNAHYGTINYAPAIAQYNGFPPRPYYYKYVPTRIDYVFSTVAPRRHEVVLYRTSTGLFNNAYRASDHNMIIVTLPLG